jgi:transposase
MELVDDPDERVEYASACCRDCGAGLAGEPVLSQRRYQVTEIGPAPRPTVTEHLAQPKRCPCCGTVNEPVLAQHVRARASYGPEVHAQAANLVSGHYLPVARAAQLLAQLAGITVSTGWVAAVRSKAAARIGASGFLGRVRDRTPARPVTSSPAPPEQLRILVQIRQNGHTRPGAQPPDLHTSTAVVQIIRRRQRFGAAVRPW